MNDTSRTLETLTIDSPIGPITLVADDEALVEVRLPPEDWSAFVGDGSALETGGTDAAGQNPVLRQAADQLREYFAGERRNFDVPLAPRGTEFQLAAWGALRSIPYGETVSYGEQARRLGDRNLARAVGAANGRNPLPIVVPCHRVVGANGHLTGFGGGIACKAWLLDHERSHATR